MPTPRCISGHLDRVEVGCKPHNHSVLSPSCGKEPSSAIEGGHSVQGVLLLGAFDVPDL